MGNDAVGFARKGACGLEGNVLQYDKIKNLIFQLR